MWSHPKHYLWDCRRWNETTKSHRCLSMGSRALCVTCWRMACACALVIALVVGTVCLWKSNPLIWIPADGNTVNETCCQRNRGHFSHCGFNWQHNLRSCYFNTAHSEHVAACLSGTCRCQVEGKHCFNSDSSCDGKPKLLHICMHLVGEFKWRHW